MATTLEKLLKANRWRVRTGPFASTEVDGWNGHFLVPMDGEMWFVRISDGMGFRHLSITNAQKKVVPSWKIMCRVKESFWGDEDWVVLYIPPKDENVNVHPFCLHLWESIDEPMPHPLVALV